MDDFKLCGFKKKDFDGWTVERNLMFSKCKHWRIRLSDSTDCSSLPLQWGGAGVDIGSETWHEWHTCDMRPLVTTLVTPDIHHDMSPDPFLPFLAVNFIGENPKHWNTDSIPCIRLKIKLLKSIYHSPTSAFILISDQKNFKLEEL